MTNIEPDKLKITFFLSEFLSGDIQKLSDLRIYDRVEVTQSIGQRIALTDKAEKFLHVQFNDLDTNAALEKPIVWHKKDWDTHYPNYVKKKKDQADERLRLNKQTENIERTAVALAKMTGLTKDHMREAASKMIQLKQYDLLEKMGVYVDK